MTQRRRNRHRKRRVGRRAFLIGLGGSVSAALTYYFLRSIPAGNNAEPAPSPQAAPNPALPETRKPDPPSHSPRNAPTNGAIKIHSTGGGRKIPTKTPTNAPSPPRQVAPNFLAPIHDMNMSAACAKAASAPHMPTFHHPSCESGSASLNANIAAKESSGPAERAKTPRPPRPRTRRRRGPPR